MGENPAHHVFVNWDVGALPGAIRNQQLVLKEKRLRN
jgi:hypothetical protein